MRAFRVLLILLVILCARLAVAEEDSDVQPDGQILLNTVNTEPPPPTDEYKYVPPAMLMTQAPPVAEPEPGQTDQDIMSMEDLITAYDKGEYDVVAQHIIPIANGNYPQAEELLGMMYYKGQGVSEDDETAVEWFTKAAEAGRPLSQHYLATLTYAGKGTSQDSVAALMWLYIAIVHYPDGPDRARAMQDRDNMAQLLSRRDRARAYELAHDWLKKKDESALLDQEPPTP